MHQYLDHVVSKKDRTPTRMAPACHASVQNSLCGNERAAMATQKVCRY